MSTLDVNAWLSGLVRRLLLVREDFAEAPASERDEYLREEVARALREVPTAERRSYLEAALERFPVAGVEPRGGDLASSCQKERPGLSQGSPEEVFERFLEALSAAPQEQRDRWIGELAAAGLLTGHGGASPAAFELADEQRRWLGLQGGGEVPVVRVLRLASRLLDLLEKLDTTTRAALKELNDTASPLPLPVSTLTAPELAGRYLAGDDEALEAWLRSSGRVWSALCHAVLLGGKEFGRHFVELYSPIAVEEVVRTEPAPLFGNFDARCWKKYKDLARSIETPELVGRQLKDCMVRMVGGKLQGDRGR